MSSDVHPHGTVVVYGTGGVGTTTIAINLAITMQRKLGHILLVDADFQFGIIPSGLNVPIAGTLFDLINYENLSSDQILDVVWQHNTGLHVLAAPSRPEQLSDISQFKLRRCLTALNRHYNAVVIDSQRELNANTFALFDLARQIILVTTNDAIDYVRFRKAMALIDSMFPRRYLCVINRLPVDVPLSTYEMKVPEIERRIERPFTAQFEDFGNDAAIAINTGTPLIDFNTSAKRKFATLASDLIQIETNRRSRFMGTNLGYVHPNRDNIGLVIVDDIPEARENLKELFAYVNDIEVLGTASTGREGITIAKEIVPDIILMDINMPDMDGITATHELRRLLPSIGVIMMSVQGEAEYIRRAAAAGAKDFLTKPPPSEELYASIRSVYDMMSEGFFDTETAAEPSIPFADAEASPLDIVTVVTEHQEISERERLLQIDPALLKLMKRLREIAFSNAHDMRTPLILTLEHTANLFQRTSSNNLQTIMSLAEVALLEVNSFLAVSFFEHSELQKVDVINLVAQLGTLLENDTNRQLLVRNGLHFAIEARLPILRIAIYNLLLVLYELTPDSSSVIARSDDQYIEFVFELNDSSLISQLARQVERPDLSKPLGHRLFVVGRALRAQSLTFTFTESDTGRAVCSIRQASALKKSWTNGELDILRQEVVNSTNRLQQAELMEYDNNFIEQIFKKIIDTFSHRILDLLARIKSYISEFSTEQNPGVLESVSKIKLRIKFCDMLVRNLWLITNDIAVNLEQSDLIAVFEDVKALLARKAGQADLVTDVIPETLSCFTDVTSLTQVLMNLARNSVQALQSKGSIMLHAHKEQDTVVIEVIDTGQGIPLELHDRIFQLGFTTRTGGYGVGLHSVTSLLSKLNGKITFTSEPGLGTMFQIALPIGERHGTTSSSAG